MTHADLLPVFINNADVDIAVDLPDMVAGGLELRRALEFCGHFRIRGIASFLLTGDATRMNNELSRSGHAFLHWVRSGGVAPSSRAKPFFDAVAAGDTSCARELALAVLPAWRRELELEDDYLFARYLMQRFFLDAVESVTAATLARWEALLDGETDARFELCQALRDGDVDLFDDALRRWLGELEDDWAQRIDSEAVIPEIAATDGRIGIEGIALIRIGEMGGFRLEQNYPMAPDIARPPTPASYDAGAWHHG